MREKKKRKKKKGGGGGGGSKIYFSMFRFHWGFRKGVTEKSKATEKRISKFIIYHRFPHHLTYPITASAVGSPQMTSQPVFSITLYCPLELGEFQACPFLDVAFIVIIKTTTTTTTTTITTTRIIIIIIYPLTARVVGAQQIISQPVSSIFPCSLLLSWTWRIPGLSIP